MNTDLREAARTLHTSLEDQPWFQAVGITVIEGADGLIVYVSRDNRRVRGQIPTTWKGFPVAAERMGRMVP